jgi:RNA polymerase sigma-70 factor (ECF subfamily)
LLERIARRDGSAIGELYDRHARVLFAIVCRIVRDQGEAEDVLQEAFVRVWEKADTYNRALGTPAAWLIRIARNRAIDRLRARRARPVTEPQDDAVLVTPADEQVVPGPERAAERSEERGAIAAALTHLTSEQRLLIEAAFYEGYTQSELAEKFHLPLGTVKTRIRTGMMALRGQLQHIAY